jgi:ASC-1-like (ASCH) protein
MAKKHLHIRPEWGEAIRAGRKDIDARPADEVAGLEVGEIIRYPAVRCRVLRVAYYRGFRDLLTTEDWRRVAPDAGSQDAALGLLEGGHTEAGHPAGVVAVELEVVKE